MRRRSVRHAIRRAFQRTDPHRRLVRRSERPKIGASVLARKVRKKLGEILVGDGVVEESVIVTCETEARESGKRLGEVLVEKGFATEIQVGSGLARQAGMDFVDLGTAEGSGQVDLSLVDEEIVRKHCVIPLSSDSGRLRLLIHEPMDLEMLDLLRFRLPQEFDLVVGVKSQMTDWIGEGAAAKLGGGGEAGPDSIDVTVDKSVDSSVDSSIDSSIDVDTGSTGCVTSGRVFRSGTSRRSSPG